jgi:hypothetical protein
VATASRTISNWPVIQSTAIRQATKPGCNKTKEDVVVALAFKAGVEEQRRLVDQEERVESESVWQKWRHRWDGRGYSVDACVLLLNLRYEVLSCRS